MHIPEIHIPDKFIYPKIDTPESAYNRNFSIPGGTQKFIVFTVMKQASVPTGTSRYIIIISTLFEEIMSILPVLCLLTVDLLTVVWRLRSPYSFRRTGWFLHSYRGPGRSLHCFRSPSRGLHSSRHPGRSFHSYVARPIVFDLQVDLVGIL